MGRRGGGKKPRTDTQTDKRGRLNGQTDMPELVQTPQVNAKCDVVMKLSVLTPEQTHTQGKTYTSSLRGL